MGVESCAHVISPSMPADENMEACVEDAQEAFPVQTYVSKGLTEFLGTGFLVFTVAMSVGAGSPYAAIAIGFILLSLVYMGGHLSGAHYNPAVTLGVLIRGKIDPFTAAIYFVCQMAGAFTFGGLAQVFDDDVNGIGYPARADDSEWYGALVAEVVITFALVHTILHVATSQAQSNNNYFGLAIGFTVASGAISVGPISGGCFNPAVSVLCILKDDFDDFWIYWVGPLVGGALAALLFRLLHPEECGEQSEDCKGQEGPEFSKYVTEFVGTFLLCFTIGVAAAPGNPGLASGLAPLSIGAMLLAQVYAGGATSGAHYNPAVSIGVLVRFFTAANGPACRKLKEKFSIFQFVLYVLVQCAAAIAAGGLARCVMDGFSNTHGAYPYPGPNTTVGRAFLLETITSFALVLVVLNTATVAKTSGNGYFGVAIGFTVSSMAFFAGGISGGAFNPAVALMALTSGDNVADVGQIWIYFVACPLGGLLAGLCFRVQNFGDFVCEQPGPPQYNEHAEYDERKLLKHRYHSDLDLHSLKETEPVVSTPMETTENVDSEPKQEVEEEVLQQL